MGVKERNKTAERARARGREAFLKGLPRSANPYRATATWGVGHFYWDQGWRKASERADKARDYAMSEYYA